MHERLCHLDALPHSLGVAAQAPARLLDHADQFQGLDCPSLGVAARETAQARHALHKLASRHLLVETIGVRAVADMAFGLRVPGVVAANKDSAEVRP